MLRAFLEQFTSRWRFWRQLPVAGAHVPVLVSPSGGLKFLFRPMREADPQLIGLAEDYVRPGMVIWDIGANLGLFSFSAAHLAGANGKVLAFEPDVWLVEGLRRSARRQPVTSALVTIIPAAVANHVSLRTFSIAARSRASNHLAEYGASETGGTAESQTVPAFSLDWMAENNTLPDIIKIDVEGAEREVLDGGTALFGQKRPIVICEVGPESRDGVTRFFRERGYVLHSGLVPKSARAPLETASWSTIAVPA